MGKKTRVLVIDDSAVVRELLTEILQADPDIEVVGTAVDPIEARDCIKKLSPDVLTLDVEMPRMDGLTFLSNLMRLRPMPVVMISSLTEAGAEVTLDALEMGAIDFVSKPTVAADGGLEDYAEEICIKVKIAASARVHPKPRRSNGRSRGRRGRRKHSADAIIAKQPANKKETADKVICIGASTGGTEAIEEVLSALPVDCPGVLVVQHIPDAFCKPFARRLDDSVDLTVVHLEDDAKIMPGHVYLAPGSDHLLLERRGSMYIAKLSDGVPVNRHRPSVDVLFRSAAQAAGANAVGVILTGMGDDGAAGLLELQKSGAATIAQDKRSCVVYGMPKRAVELGAVDDVLPLNKVAGRLMELVARQRA